MNFQVYIYNWKEVEWRLELELPLNDMSDPACGRIKDPYTDRVWILIAGGFDATKDANSDRVWLWDPENNEVLPGPALPAANDGMHLIEYAETEVLMIGGYHGDQVSIFTTIFYENQKGTPFYNDEKKIMSVKWFSFFGTVFIRFIW